MILTFLQHDDIKSYIWTFLSNNDKIMCYHTHRFFWSNHIEKFEPMQIIKEFHDDIDKCEKLIFWYFDNGYSLHEKMCEQAAEYGSIKLLSWLLVLDCPIDSDEVTKIVALSDNKRMIKWIHNRGYPISRKITAISAEFGYLDILKWFYKHLGKLNTQNDFKHAIIGNQIETLLWIYHNTNAYITQSSTLLAIELSREEIYNWMAKQLVA